MLILLGNDIPENPGPFDNEISIFHLNIRSIRHKLDYVEALALGSSIVCITESHLDDTVLSRDIQIQGYHDNILRKDRNCFGGGVLVYISETLKLKRRDDLEFENSEMIWVEIEFPNYKVLLCVVYRSPGATQSFWQNFEYSIEEAFNYTTNVIITGDLNIDLLVENNNSLSNIINVFYLQNVIHEPTRINQNTGNGTLLDPVLISADCNATFSEVIDVCREKSDHNATKISLQIPNYLQKTYQRTIWMYKNADFEKFNKLIRQFNWEESFFTLVNDIDEMADFFTNKYLEMAKECIPTKVVNIRRTDKPWFNSEIRHHIRIRDRLHRKLKTSPTVHNRNIYKIRRNKVNNMIIHAKEQFYLNANGLLDENSNNPKAFWSLVKKVMGNCRSTVIPPLINPVTNDIVVNESDKANVLNNYFCSISSTANNIDPPNLPRRTPFSLDVDDINDDDVKDILKSLQIGKASGGDFISHQMLKNTADTVYLPLKYIFNHSLRISKYPSCWKIANVLSLFKKGDKSIASNYRPIALLSCVGKVFERIVFKYIYNYMLEHKLLYKFQSGFVSGHSTSHQLIELYHQICIALENGQITVAVFCDISKAFDRLWHKGLIEKLKSYGINGKLLKWLKDYISERKQQV